MKYILLIMTTLSILNIESLASCLVRVENKEEKYFFSIWKHKENENDDVYRFSMSDKDLQEVEYILNKYKSITFIFNKGSFTSMKYDNERTLLWANLSQSEKDLVHYIQNKFNVNEK